MAATDGIDKALGGAPGTQRMGTGGADAYLENVEYGDGFVWQVVFFYRR